jgi:hypothetical protein
MNKDKPKWIGGDPRILNTLKIDLAIERNEVEELIEIVVGLRIKNKELDSSKLNESQVINASTKNKSVLNFGSQMILNSEIRKDSMRASKKKKKEFTPEEKIAILHQIALLIPLF